MRIAILLIFVLFQPYASNGQTSLKEISLDNGKYKVGFRHYTISDSTRTIVESMIIAIKKFLDQFQ